MRSLLLAAAALPLAACATPGDPQGTASAAAAAEEARPGGSYGLFLAGRAALNAGQPQQAERLFSRARAGSSDTRFLQSESFGAALAAGDIARAVALAPGPGADASERSLGRLAQVVSLLAGKREKEAYAVLVAEPLTTPHTLAAALLKPWAAAAAGQPIEGPVEGQGRTTLEEAVADVGGIALLERAGRFADADAKVAALDAAGASPNAIVTHGAYLERRRRGAEAVRLYETALAARPNDADIRAALARARAGRAPPAPPTIRQGAAEGLLVPALILAGSQQSQTALAYLRLALHLDPKRDEAWVALGELLADEGDLEGARRAYLTPKLGSPQFALSRARLAFALEEAGRKEEALETARVAAEAAPDVQPLQEAYAALLTERNRHADVVALFDKVLATEAGAQSWRAWYLRGAAHERAGSWAQAERDLQKALSMAPNEAEILNYLGYSWVDRGQRLQEAMSMIERAAELRPRSGAIVDSLGWAHYRLGDYAAAVERLERAAELEPSDPVINDHLGDAYWRTGRRIEAHFQWRRVLTLEPDAKLRAAVEAKLASPQGPDAPIQSVAANP